MKLLTCDEERRGQIVGMLFGAFGQANDAHRQAIYTKVLGDIPNEILSKAVKKLLLESKFLPSIAEVVEAGKSLMGTADDSTRVREWAEAWDEIERAMQATPWGHTPVFSRIEIKLAVRSFGWHDLQMTLAEDMPTVRAQVRRMYEDVCRRTKEHGHNEYVLGRNKTGLLQPSTPKPKGLTSMGDVLARIEVRK